MFLLVFLKKEVKLVKLVSAAVLQQDNSLVVEKTVESSTTEMGKRLEKKGDKCTRCTLDVNTLGTNLLMRNQKQTG